MKTYEQFLLAELLFQRDELLFHTIPYTACRYEQLFGQLEQQAEELNINIRMLRQMIQLLAQGMPKDEVETAVQKDFRIPLEELAKRQHLSSHTAKSSLSAAEKEELNELYRRILLSSSPLLHELTKEQAQQFLQMQQAFSLNQLDLLRSFTLPQCKEKLLSSEEMEEIKGQLEVEIAQYYCEFPMNQQAMMDDERTLQFNYDRLERIIREYSLLYCNLEEEYHLTGAKQMMK